MRSTGYHNFANISESGPFTGLNFGMQSNRTVGHTLLRPKTEDEDYLADNQYSS